MLSECPSIGHAYGELYFPGSTSGYHAKYK